MMVFITINIDISNNSSNNISNLVTLLATHIQATYKYTTDNMKTYYSKTFFNILNKF